MGAEKQQNLGSTGNFAKKRVKTIQGVESNGAIFLKELGAWESGAPPPHPVQSLIGGALPAYPSFGMTTTETLKDMLFQDMAQIWILDTAY